MSASKIDRERAVALYRAGYTTKEIAGRFGVKSPAVTRVLTASGINLNRKGGSREGQRNRLADLVADGHTVEAAASIMGVGKAWAMALWRSICADLGAQAR
jgi:transposase